jgi:hypothetical protein
MLTTSSKFPCTKINSVESKIAQISNSIYLELNELLGKQCFIYLYILIPWPQGAIDLDAKVFLAVSVQICVTHTLLGPVNLLICRCYPALLHWRTLGFSRSLENEIFLLQKLTDLQH